MIELLKQPWPWYVAGPLVGLIVPILLLAGGKLFGVSENFRHICAAVMPGRLPYFQYDWKEKGLWNLLFLAGAVGGGYLGGWVLANPDPVSISGHTVARLQEFGFHDFNGLMPRELFSWESLATLPGFLALVVGGFLVGFGTRYAGGCTSGHAISGLADLQVGSLIAVIGFFIGGLTVTWLIFPLLFG